MCGGGLVAALTAACGDEAQVDVAELPGGTQALDEQIATDPSAELRIHEPPSMLKARLSPATFGLKGDDDQVVIEVTSSLDEDDGADSGSGRDDFTSGQAAGSIGVPFLDKCEGTTAGRATEMDYTRVLWNVHTDGSTPPTFTDIARWIRDCSGIAEYNVYTRLDECAEPRNDGLEANWDANKVPHSIDNPAP